jgi:VanZ family protein
MAERVRRLAVILFWMAALIALVMANLPRPPHIPGEPGDKIQHMLAFAVLASLARNAWPNRSTVFLIAGLSVFGALIEITQGLLPFNRDAEVLDWIADTAACAAVFAIAAGWRRLGNGQR